MKRLIIVVGLILALSGIFLIPSTEAQTTSNIRVIRVANSTEPDAEFFGIDYKNASYVVATGGYLVIKDSAGVKVATWAPNFWARVENVQ